MKDYTRYMDILTRLFPEQKRDVLELVLRGCGGDFAHAIECILPSHEEATFRGQRIFRSPAFHPIPSLFSSLTRAITPFPSPTFPGIPFRPLCTHPNCKGLRSGFDVGHSAPRSYGCSQDLKNGGDYFRYQTPTFMSLPEKLEKDGGEREIKDIPPKTTIEERRDEASIAQRAYYT